MARPKKTAPEDVQQLTAPEDVQVVLVLMTKGEEQIEVHPTCVIAHEKAGWKVAK